MPTIKNRLAKLEKSRPYKQKKIKFIEGSLPNKLDPDIFYINVIGERAKFNTDGESFATIETRQATVESIDAEIRALGYDPTLFSLDEGYDHQICTFQLEMRQAKAQGFFLRYPGGKSSAQFVLEMPKKPDDSVFYVLVEKEPGNNSR